jgi:hypothetical protein
VVPRATTAFFVTAIGAACTFSDLEHLSDGVEEAGHDSGAPVFEPDGSIDAPVDADASDGAADAGMAGLVGWWKLDETSGTVAEDSSPLHNPGVLLEGATWQPATGREPGGLRLDGLDDYVEIAGTVAYATQHAAFSFSAWFNVTDFAQDMYPDIMQLRTDSETPWHVLLSTDPGFFGISVGSASGWVPIKTGVIPSTGVWHHVAVRYDGTDSSAISSFQIALDGVAQPLTAASGYGEQVQGSRIGASYAGNQWKGLIRDVRIYDRLLTTAEAAALFAAP